MYIVILTSLIALLLTFLESKKIVPNGLRWGFVLVTFLGCIHYDYGNDYLSYVDIYNDTTRYPFDLDGFIAGDAFKEPGWAFLCYLFEPIGGFFMMVAALNILQNVLVYKTIKHYVEKTWWPMAVFIYLFSTNLYLLNFSMMRQGLVVCIFLGIWPWIEQKKWIKATIILLLCYTIHKSALVLLPFAFWGFIPMKNSKLLVVSFIVIFIVLWGGKSFLNEIFASFMTIEDFSNYADIYENSANQITFRIGYLINQIPFIFGLLYLFQDKNKDSSTKSVVTLAIISFLIAPFLVLIPLMSRVSYYFISYHIIAIPVIYSNLKNNTIRTGFLGIYICMMLYDYWRFYCDPIWIDKYTIFKTIFSQIF